MNWVPVGGVFELRDVHGFTLLIVIWRKILGVEFLAVESSALNSTILKNSRCDRCG